MQAKRPQIHILRSQVDDKMRVQILDMVQYTNEKLMNRSEALKYIKTKTEFLFNGKWQIIIGDKYTTYFDEKLFPYFM